MLTIQYNVRFISVILSCLTTIATPPGNPPKKETRRNSSLWYHECLELHFPSQTPNPKVCYASHRTAKSQQSKKAKRDASPVLKLATKQSRPTRIRRSRKSATCLKTPLKTLECVIHTSAYPQARHHGPQSLLLNNARGGEAQSSPSQNPPSLPPPPACPGGGSGSSSASLRPRHALIPLMPNQCLITHSPPP